MGDTPVATIRPGTPAVVYYVHADHLNAPRMVTRPSDNKIAWRWDTDPFGTVAPNQNPQSLGTFVYNLRCPGQYYDSETGLNYNYFRDYDPQVGRYVESDPVGLQGGINTYAYTKSNPVMWKDPRGLDVYTCFDLGTCYFNQPSDCIYNPSLCEPVRDPGNPVAACTIRKILIDQLGGIPADKIKDTIVDKITKRMGQTLKATCKLSVKILSIAWDVRGAYVSYLECKKCPDESCPVN